MVSYDHWRSLERLRQRILLVCIVAAFGGFPIGFIFSGVDRRFAEVLAGLSMNAAGAGILLPFFLAGPLYFVVLKSRVRCPTCGVSLKPFRAGETSQPLVVRCSCGFAAQIDEFFLDVD